MMGEENDLGQEGSQDDSIAPDKFLENVGPDLVELVESAIEELREKDLHSFAESFNLLSFALPSQDREALEGLYASFLDEAKSRGVKLEPLGSPACPFSLAEEEGEFSLSIKGGMKSGRPNPAPMPSLPVSAGISMPGTDQLNWLYEAKRVYYDGLESFKAATKATGDPRRLALMEAMADFELALAYFPQGEYLEREEKLLKEEIGFDYVHCCSQISRLDPASRKNCSMKSEGIARSLSVFDRLILWTLDRMGR